MQAQEQKIVRWSLLRQSIVLFFKRQYTARDFGNASSL